MTLCFLAGWWKKEEEEEEEEEVKLIYIYIYICTASINSKRLLYLTDRLSIAALSTMPPFV